MYMSMMVIAPDTRSGVSSWRPRWLKKVRGLARSGAMAQRMVWAMDFTTMPTRSALMPPEIDDADPPMHIPKMTTNNAPVPMA